MICLSQIGGAAVVGCFLGDDLVTESCFIETRTIRDKGFYLFKDGVSCDGRITLLELCGIFTNPLTPNHFFTAVYRPHLENGTYTFDRIAASVHHDIDPVLVRMSCTSLVVNWRVQKGDFIAVSFTNSCPVENLAFGYSSERQDVPVCPVYAALETNNSQDEVYFSHYLDTDNSSITEDDLTTVSGVKINLQATVGKCMHNCLLKMPLCMHELMIFN